MKIRFLAGWRGLVAAAGIASLILLPGMNASAEPTPLTKAAPASSESIGTASSVKVPTLFPRSNYQWPFGAGPYYGDVDATQWQATGVLHTSVGSFDLTRGLPAFPSELRTGNKLGKLAGQYFVMLVDPAAFGDGRFDQIRSAITSNGGVFAKEMTVYAYIVRLNAAALGQIQGASGIVAMEPWHPAFKIYPNVGRIPLPDPAKAISEVYDLDVQLFAGEDAQAVASEIAAMGGNVLGIFPDTIRVELNRSKLGRLAALEPVFEIYEHVPMFPHGQESAATVQTGRWNDGDLPYNLAGVHGGGAAAGQEQILMVLDSGIQLDAGDLSDTRTNPGTAGTNVGNLYNASGEHRKVRLYSSTAGFGGTGDTLGCDNPGSGGYTHGHVVSATALGASSSTAVAGGTGTGYGTPWSKTDTSGNAVRFDGLAPKALLIAYDGQTTPASLGCDDPGQGGIVAGTLYSAPSGGSLGTSYTTYGARVSNFSWGATNANTYGTQATQIDTFLSDKQDAMVFISAGNASADTDSNGIPDPSTVSEPATAKNAVIVGASGSANDTAGPGANGPNTRAGFSSVGPVIGGRVAPLLMAPGTDSGTLGLANEYSCRTTDNDSTGTVQCETAEGLAGTSFASPAAAGAALLVRDYFKQGFYPDGTNDNPANAGDIVNNISGALVKATLIASADWMNAKDGSNNDTNLPGGGLTFRYRFNNQQGYGRIQLTNALPIENYPSAKGLIVSDAPNVNSASSLSGNIAANGTETYLLNVCDNTQDLKVALAWLEPSGSALLRNLDLEMVNPAGTRTYYGNYFTDDDNKSGVLDAGEDCVYSGSDPWPAQSAAGIIDQGPWSLPVCVNSDRDTANPTEAVFLGADSKANGLTDNPATSGINEGADNQVDIGNWTVRIINRNATNAQKYAVAMAGPVCIGSAVSLSVVNPDGSVRGGAYNCNSKARITVNEVDEANDPQAGLTPAEIQSRTTLQVVDAGADLTFDTGDDVIKDTETAVLSFVQTGLKYVSNDITLTDGTAPDPGNGALDVADGQRVRVIYQDELSGTPDANKKRVQSLTVDCKTTVVAGGVIFAVFGKDAIDLVSGGCEKDARGLFTFGFPDKYMDAGEALTYDIAWRSGEDIDLDDVKVTLRAVDTDGNSPADCLANSLGSCADPNRLDNPANASITVINPTQTLGRLNAGGIFTSSFQLSMASSIAGTPQVEMVLGVSARKAGKPIESYVVRRHRLDVDEVSFYYSTDFPTGGTVTRDINNNESIEAPIWDPGGFLYYGQRDYEFETRTYANSQATSRNLTLNSPWNFDTNNGGFSSGITNNTTKTLATLSQWGEDKNFNGTLDAGEDRDPVNGVINQNWSTNGGCGWQTRGTAATGGVWHTGRIDVTSLANCTANGTTAARCQNYETVPGYFLNNVWFELLVTPQIQKVNQCPAGSEAATCTRNGGTVSDSSTDKVFNVELVNWAWNVAMNIADTLTGQTYEFDNDVATTTVDLYNDFGILNSVFGVQGAISGGNAPITDGFNLFAPISKCLDFDGNGTPDHCGFRGGVACTSDTQCTGNTVNGSLGASRQGQNNCFFEGKVSGVVKALDPFGLAKPLDDDVRNGWCPNTDPGQGADKSKTCVTNADCAAYGAPYSGTCTFDGATTIDQFVQNNGPVRNYDASQSNGVFLPYDTLEDLYGEPMGDSFQGAVGFYTQEGSPSAQPAASYGIAVDDMVVEWREFKLDKDVTACTGGECAVLEIGTLRIYEGRTLIPLTVTDKYPWDTAPGDKNDCNGDGDYTDIGRCAGATPCVNDSACGNGICLDGFCAAALKACTVSGDCPGGETCQASASFADDTDCNNNGTEDVTVLLTSGTEPSGEIAVLDRTSPGSAFWSGNAPVSGSYDAKGVLYVARVGTSAPVVTAQYEDRNYDGTGASCPNDTNATRAGFVVNSTLLTLDAGRLAIATISVDDDNIGGTTGDGDGYPDTNETVDITLSFKNKSGADVSGLKASLATTSPNIACITSPTANVGTIVNKGSGTMATPFRLRVADVNRTTVDQNFKASFTVTLSSDQYDVTTRALTFDLDLDLDATGGSGPITFNEGFEGTTFGQFTSMSLDLAKASTAGSNGYRCQYNDPDGPNSNDPGRTSCFLGFTTAANNAYDWHIHDGSAAQNSITRAYVGAKSLHWGVHPTSGAKRDTTRFSQLDAIRTTNPINIAVGISASPELSYAHQISLTDSRSTNTPASEAADRAIVAIQLADSGGVAIGDWLKIFPYENEYDVQGTDNFSNCIFDPIDDGNNEDSWADDYNPPWPGADLSTDPLRRLGPSSTCFPEFAFAWHGDTDYRNSPGLIDDQHIGRAFDGPPLQGSVNRGTWVRPRYNLFGYKGRRIRVRMLATTIEVAGAVTVNDTSIGSDNNTGDDGWYIDDFTVTSALTSAATLAVDTKANAGFPVCAACTTISAAISASTSTTGAPGQPVSLNAASSTSDACRNAVLQYQWWTDDNNDSVIGNAGDTLQRDWTDNPSLNDAPLQTTRYGVIVRCPSSPACGTSSASTVVTVNCPASGTLTAQFTQSVSFTNKTTLSWATSASYDAVKGNLDLLRSGAKFNGSVLSCLANNQTGTTLVDAASPSAGSGFYYLLRPVSAFCNQIGAYSNGTAKEKTGVGSRDEATQGIPADPNKCP